MELRNIGGSKMNKKILCVDGIERTQKKYEQWLFNLQEMLEIEPNDLTNVEWLALEKEGLIY